MTGNPRVTPLEVRFGFRVECRQESRAYDLSFLMHLHYNKNENDVKAFTEISQNNHTTFFAMELLSKSRISKGLETV
jgi:hypothetical protein